ncbi:phage tail protein, partial [Citrobacter freundii]|uniref:phage tail protein n=1 Tax=Citrobacter freundii TaxID=546 RepID=UPI002E11638A
MATKYYAVLTNVGAAKLANATALGAQVEITQMAVGDGNGVLPTPNPAQTALVHELRRKPLNSLSIDPNNANQIIAEQVIPEDEGGWWIREIGLFDKDGDMIAVANCAETYKPQLQEGSGRVQVVRMILIVSSTAAVTLKIDPSVVLATRQYVDDQIIQVKSYVDQKMAAHVAAADPHKQYAPKESPALTGRPTAPTAEGKDSSTQIANTAFVQAAIAALVGSSPEALDTLNELAAALGNDPNFATTVTNSLAGKMDKSANGSDIENVSVFLQNLGLDRFVQTKGNPNMRLILDDASWYVYDSVLKKNIALALNMGGTGATDAAGARANLELGNSATKNTGKTSGTVAAGDDSRITGALQKTGGDVTGPLRRVGSYPSILLTDSTMDDATIGKTVGIEQSKGRLTFYLRSGDGSSSSGQVLFNMPDITGSKTLITKEECDVRYQQQTRLGAESRYGANDNYIAVPAG